MEKRFVSFIVLSMLILIGFQMLDARLNPRPEVPEDAVAVADDPGPDGQEGDETADSDAESATDSPVAEVSEGEIDSTNDSAAETAADSSSDTSSNSNDGSATASFSAPERRVTLGTLDPERPERLLVWFNSRGATIECAALNNTKYNDLERHHGYLGFLGFVSKDDACEITVVGDGTPAALATQLGGGPTGLQPGDVLLAGDDESFASVGDFESWLETTRAKQVVELRVKRSGRELTFNASLSRYPLQVIRPESSQSDNAAPDHPLSYRLSLQQLGGKILDYAEEELEGLPSLRDENWQIKQDVEGQIEFHYVLSKAEVQPFGGSGPLRIIKRFRLPNSDVSEHAYHLHYEVELRNEADGGDPISVAYQQDGPTGLPLEGWWYTYKTHPSKMGVAGVRDIVTKAFGGKYKMFTNPNLVERLDENPKAPGISMFEDESPAVQFVGVDSQYFVSALVSDVQVDGATPDNYIFSDAIALPLGPKDPEKPTRTDVTFRLISRAQTLEAGESYKQTFLVFAGPKQAEVLAQYGLDECITFGWFPLVAKPLTWILHVFYGVFRNYGIAIVMLTVLVRSCMLPIGRQQALNAAKMQELAPEMRKIADKYKDDMEKRANEQRKLFQKHNYNPLAGCLPMFIQLPIFIGLYRALSVDIELRQAALIPGLRWCSNLAGPDQLFNWEGFMPAMLASRTGWLGPYLNVLPLITVALMMVQQKLFTPPPTDEQQEMQQKMMKYMMLFFGLMFFRVPAGLCLYFITTNLWSVGERKLVPRPQAANGQPPAAEEKKTPVRSGAGGGSGGGRSGGGRGKKKRR